MTGKKRVAYLEGTAARQLAYGYEAERLPAKKKLSHRARKNRERVSYMTLGYVGFLFAAMVVMLYMLTGYLHLQSELTGHVKTLANLKTQYTNLKLANDEAYNRICTNVDLERIRAVAIGELGMVYAQEGQIVTIEDSNTDFVRQSKNLK